MNQKKIMDVCCGSRMFWFDKENPNVLFNDIRNETCILCDGRKLSIKPNTRMDFTNLKNISDCSMKLVVFDPPHLHTLGEKSWMAKKYGRLDMDWKKTISAGFKECFRILDKYGVLIFKWNETQTKTSEILKLTNRSPLFGHISGKRSKTHWICFLKT